jgi:glycerol-3-phosphate dehydrogenase (NAD(P)+)
MKMVAEGYYATKAIYDLAKEYQIELPILEAVYSILYEKHPANVEFSRLSSFLG